MLNAPIVDTCKSHAAMKFIENKRPDMALVSTLLEECASANQWANFGPLYHRLADEYAEHMELAPGLVLTPCANAGVGLELLARGLAQEQDVLKLRWVGSAFSFKNLGRGYFADMAFLDCDTTGMLDLDALKRLPVDSYDGFVVTNPLGMSRDFDRFIAFAQKSGKHMLIDNAAGMDPIVPNWPFQVFSLHHTKPYGIGEGGLILSPSVLKQALIHLFNYDKVPNHPAQWLNNCKISDIACAFQIARLKQLEDWSEAYRDQRARIAGIFSQFGITSLTVCHEVPLTNSLAVLFPTAFDMKKMRIPRRIAIARQYEPLVSRPVANDIHAHIVQFPSHPDMVQLSDADIYSEIELLLDCCQ